MEENNEFVEIGAQFSVDKNNDLVYNITYKCLRTGIIKHKKITYVRYKMQEEEVCYEE